MTLIELPMPESIHVQVAQAARRLGRHAATAIRPFPHRRKTRPRHHLGFAE
jgi:hypothetical protein